MIWVVLYAAVGAMVAPWMLGRFPGCYNPEHWKTGHHQNPQHAWYHWRTQDCPDRDAVCLLAMLLPVIWPFFFVGLGIRRALEASDHRALRVIEQKLEAAREQKAMREELKLLNKELE
jgi:hypothetical protein